MHQHQHDTHLAGGVAGSCRPSTWLGACSAWHAGARLRLRLRLGRDSPTGACRDSRRFDDGGDWRAPAPLEDGVRAQTGRLRNRCDQRGRVDFPVDGADLQRRRGLAGAVVVAQTTGHADDRQREQAVVALGLEVVGGRVVDRGSRRGNRRYSS